MRMKTIEFAGLNIVLHPHSAERYCDLFDSVAELCPTTPTAVWGSFHGMLRFLSPLNRANRLGGYNGVALKFVITDPGLPYVELATADYREPTEDIPSPIPKDFGVNARQCSFHFDPIRHFLVYDVKALSVRQAVTLFESIFERPDIVEKFGEVSVRPVSSSGAIEHIFEVPKIKSVYFDVSQPNPDQLTGLQDELVKRLVATNTGRLRETHTASSSKGEGIKPDEHMRALSRLSLMNGETKVNFTNQLGKSDSRSTKDRPLRQKFEYNPEFMGEHAAVVSNAPDLYSDCGEDGIDE